MIWSGKISFSRLLLTRKAIPFGVAFYLKRKEGIVIIYLKVKKGQRGGTADERK
ncbi:hypothetical protein B4168_2961 [Anoxybacillus flavithermus]|nr:hypothetical protein B4168_2961 [Anoxybacillus flavithermus]OAO86250.1 hypothetical protein GT23_2143 [Parageobacillus thermoglucosidasius]